MIEADRDLFIKLFKNDDGWLSIENYRTKKIYKWENGKGDDGTRTRRTDDGDLLNAR